MQSLTALADPNRRRIVEMLGRGEQASGEIAAEFAVSAAAISQHLKVLREARLVQVRVEAHRRIYSRDRGGLGEIDAWLLWVRQYGSGRRDPLGGGLRRPQAATKKKRSRR